MTSESFGKRFFDLLVIFKRENVVFICQFPLMENEVVRTLTIHYNFFYNGEFDPGSG